MKLTGKVAIGVHRFGNQNTAGGLCISPDFTVDTVEEARELVQRIRKDGYWQSETSKPIETGNADMYYPPEKIDAITINVILDENQLIKGDDS